MLNFGELLDAAQEGPGRRRRAGGGTGWNPHCDSKVLHAPGECPYCDLYPEAQLLRVQWDINFTGHYEPGFLVCPAERQRGLATINHWPGNTAQGYTSSQQQLDHVPTTEEIAAARAVLQRAERELDRGLSR